MHSPNYTASPSVWDEFSAAVGTAGLLRDAPRLGFCSWWPPCPSPTWFWPASAPPHMLFLLPGWHIFL